MSVRSKDATNSGQANNPDIDNIVICGSRYSDNLGDGIIIECLANLIKQIRPTADISELDISGRDGYGTANLSRKMLMQKVIYKLPQVVKPFIVFCALSIIMPLRIIPRWRQLLHKPGILVVGGGQLFQDNSLNFPIKISRLIGQARKSDFKIAIFACGFGKTWSRPARWMFKRALANHHVFYLSGRDEESLCNIKKHLSGIGLPEPELAIDPAVWCAETYGISSDYTKTPCIGLGVAHPSEMKMMAEKPEDFSENIIAEFWFGLVEALVQKGHHVALFTNGSEEDSHFLSKVQEILRQNGLSKMVKFMPRARTPFQLVEQIAQFRAVVAHRLHANIVAFSLEVPSVGLIWDNKVRAFYKLINRDNWIVDSRELNVANVLEKINSAIEAGIDRQAVFELREKAFSSVKVMLERAEVAIRS